MEEGYATIESHVSRTGSITIRREDVDARGDGGLEHPARRPGSGHGGGGGVTDTLLALKESGREFEQRQQKLDEDLERLSLRLAETAAVHFSPLPGSQPLVVNKEEGPPPPLDTGTKAGGSFATRYLDQQRKDIGSRDQCTSETTEC